MDHEIQQAPDLRPEFEIFLRELGGVGCIGHEFAQKNLAVGVERVDHEIQQAPDLRPEFVPFHGLAHALPP